MTKYNQAVKDYNTALDETPDEANLDDIPERPCPPSTPKAFYGVPLHPKSTALDDANFDSSGDLFAFRANINQQSTDSDVEFVDSHRLGYAQVYDEFVTADGASFTAGFSGHVFGRLGEVYDKNLGGHRWLYSDTSGTVAKYRNYMQVSVLPNVGTSFLADTKEVEITASPIAIDDFAVPTPTAVGAASYEEVTGASALIASTMALGTLAYTLF